jgi:hypothetical protein
MQASECPWRANECALRLLAGGCGGRLDRAAQVSGEEAFDPGVKVEQVLVLAEEAERRRQKGGAWKR